MNAPSDDTPVTEPIAVDANGESTVRAELEKAHRQIADYKLLVADFDNARKRLTQDADRQRKYAHEPLARDLLTALDNLERAVDASKHKGESGPLVQGVNATLSLFLDILKRHGVTRIDAPPGTEFDPNRHQAVMQEPTNDHAPGSVLRVLQQGFLIHDRVLRPASVIVATEPPAGGESE